MTRGRKNGALHVAAHGVSFQTPTDSPLDFPAKTLKAGDHGVLGGENMLVIPTG